MRRRRAPTSLVPTPPPISLSLSSLTGRRRCRPAARAAAARRAQLRGSARSGRCGTEWCPPRGQPWSCGRARRGRGAREGGAPRSARAMQARGAVREVPRFGGAPRDAWATPGAAAPAPGARTVSWAGERGRVRARTAAAPPRLARHQRTFTRARATLCGARSPDGAVRDGPVGRRPPAVGCPLPLLSPLSHAFSTAATTSSSTAVISAIASACGRTAVGGMCRNSACRRGPSPPPACSASAAAAASDRK